MGIHYNIIPVTKNTRSYIMTHTGHDRRLYKRYRSWPTTLYTIPVMTDDFIHVLHNYVRVLRIHWKYTVSKSNRITWNESNIQKFLGIYIDENMNWGPHIEHCRKKMSSGLYAMNAAKRTLGTDHLRILYFSLIHPYISYGNVLWGKSYQKHIRKIETL